MIPFAFFGTSTFSVILLETLKEQGIIPELIITAPDRPVGRKQILTPPPVKDWAIENDVATFQPESLTDKEFVEALREYELFIVASYGKIIPPSLLAIPSLGTLNVHPSLLPLYRGASPIQAQILNDEKVFGTTIMLMDEKMDHGDILAQKEIPIAIDSYEKIEAQLARESATLLKEVLLKWIDKKITPVPQDHEQATFTKIIRKEDGEIDQSPSRKNYLTYLAYSHWPKTFFFFEKEGKRMRAVVTEATWENNQFIITKVIPEGRNEMTYQEFLNWTR